MKNIFSAVILTLLCLVFFSGIYTVVILGVSQAAPNKGKGEMLALNGETVGYRIIGQSFTNDNYFWSRPSSVNYNAAGSGGSNKGPSNPDYLALVQTRIDSFMVHHPYLTKKDIPAEMVTASSSGLDPDISPQSALIQVKRIAKARNIGENDVQKLVENQTKGPLFGLFGTSTVNVLQLNIALDNLK